MAFQVNTNINALTTHTSAVATQLGLKNSLEKLSSGLRINKAADDASGMTISDSLRSQASALGQAISNANDGIGIIQVADKAMDEQLKILDTIKVKATQAAQDGQSLESRKAIQSDIIRLIQGLDNIGNTTSYNGQSLLSGQWTNKEFQIGAYSNQSIKVSVGSTTSDKIGQVRINTGAMITAASEATLTFKQINGGENITLEGVKISHSVGTGLGVLAEVINKNSDKTGIRAKASVETTSDKEIMSGNLKNLTINDVNIGNIVDIKKGDADGRLVQAINALTSSTGVEASTDSKGRLNLRSVDGRGIVLKADASKDDGDGKSAPMAIDAVNGGQSITDGEGAANYGRLSLARLDARDIILTSSDKPDENKFSAIGFGDNNVAMATVNLRDVLGKFDASVKSAAGANYNAVVASGNSNLGAGVTTLVGAMLVMDIAESAQKTLDKIRSDLGSVQGQMVSTVNNISVTQVNVKAAESRIREVDFAAESAEFNKYNILAQSGSYAMSQANAVQQNILRLLS
ncbi:flagellin A [Helicobacter mustelae]|uniref:Flagellin n=1 Tax=Helicobacter mustelae (strain ATCC 43772 / CCUG 25715 / CIP 103759 / LMG 18044 / NCTC 12198 / R85-136P) TaxID=679897 RepID=D3UH73_HELM1|nr:flagellin A [Helicobacter mustelae]CBG39845.1 putative flagellin, FlaA [Helicobacter mustelae 12198]SQH71354.1 flagellin, FlaA [Helicobacter mustelae]